MRILYVEDDLRDADVTVRLLRKARPSFQLEMAPTVESAVIRLSRLASDPLDLVLTDMHLSDGDGLSLLRYIRENRKPVAVVVITGMGDEETAVAALKGRADDYVVKRSDYLDHLPAVLESALNHYRVDAARRAHPLKVLLAAQRTDDIKEASRYLAVNANHIHLNVVSSASEALYFLREPNHPDQYDVLLLEFELPELNALSLLRELRGSLKQDIPVVLLCDPENEELASQCVKRGATSYMVKRPGYLYKLPWELEDAHSLAELMRREAALQESEERFRMLAETVPVFIWITDPDKLCTYVNRSWLEFTGRTMEKTVGNGWTEAVHPDDVARCYDMYASAFDKRERFRMEYRYRRYDGEYRWVLVVGVPRFTPDGKFLGYIGSATDITERFESEAALRESETRLRLAQNAARVGTWEWHIPNGKSVWSEMIWELLGIQPDEEGPTLNRFVAFIHPEDRESALRQVYEAIAEGEEYSSEFRIVRPDGETLWLASQGRVIRSADGKAERMLGVNIDITKRRLAEDSLKSALAEVQELKDRLHAENIYLQEEIKVAGNFGEMVGQSEALTKVLHQAEQVAPLDTTTLLLGETGTGKELLAHAIHNRSTRRKRALVKVNCAALPGELIESELFGHEKGAFTGANARRSGRFEIANGGTIFLDEVGELPLDLQAKLLRVLQDGEFEPVGSSRTIRVDVRVIAATNRKLEEAVREGLFRSDLYYRLTVFPITLPSLRERKSDIPLLVKHFVQELGRKIGKQIDSIPQEAMTALKNYPWPGNIRELRNVIERAVIVTQGSKLQLLDSFGAGMEKARIHAVDEEVTIRGEGVWGETLEQSQYNLILHTLKKSYWRIEGPYGAAAALQIHPSKLRSLMKRLGIERPKMKVQSN
jgi:PAS domain S-box-containing protein